MTPAVAVEWALRMDCCAEANPNIPRHIALPHQSRLGTFEYPHYRLSADWPVTFLCLRHGHAFVRSKSNLLPEKLDPDQNYRPVWRIQCVCAREGCQESRTIYIGHCSSREDIARVIGKWNGVLSCAAGHPLQWREDLMRYERIAYNSPVR